MSRTSTRSNLTAASPLRYEQVIDTIKEGICAGRYRPGERLPAMRDLARNTGVAMMTARRALSELSRQGLVEIRSGSGTYVASNPVMSSLGVTRVGLVLPTFMADLSDHHPVIGTFVASAHRVLRSPQYSVLPLFGRVNHFSEDLADRMAAEQLGGVVIVLGRLTSEDIALLQQRDVPAVHITYIDWGQPWLVTLSTARCRSVELAVDHLRSHGHQRICFLSYRIHGDRGELHARWERLVEDHGLAASFRKALEVENESCFRWDDVDALFECDPLPTAVVVIDEFLADALLERFDRRGIRVPDDISVVALQDARPSGHGIRLTTTFGADSLRAMSEQACRLLVDRMNGTVQAGTCVDAAVKLVCGDSTGPARE